MKVLLKVGVSYVIGFELERKFYLLLIDFKLEFLEGEIFEIFYGDFSKIDFYLMKKDVCIFLVILFEDVF